MSIVKLYTVLILTCTLVGTVLAFRPAAEDIEHQQMVDKVRERNKQRKQLEDDLIFLRDYDRANGYEVFYGQFGL